MIIKVEESRVNVDFSGLVAAKIVASQWRELIANSKYLVNSDRGFLATVCKTVHPMLSVRCLFVCPVCQSVCL